MNDKLKELPDEVQEWMDRQLSRDDLFIHSFMRWQKNQKDKPQEDYDPED